MTAIFKRELKSYLTSMVGYLFIFFVLVLTGIYFSAYQLSGGYSKFEYTLSALTFVFLIGVPILSMRVLAEERKQKTDQLLLTAPVSVWDIVLGKYLALVAVFAIPVVIMCFYPLIMSKFGTVSFASAYTGILGFFLLGCANLAIGVFMSALTESQVIAAVLTIVFDLVVAIEVGVVLTALLFLKRMADVTEVKSWKYIGDNIDENNDPDSINLKQVPKDTLVYEINGPMFFAAADKFLDIQTVSGSKAVIVRMRGVPAMDVTALRSLRNIHAVCIRHGAVMILSHVNEQPMSVMEHAGFADEIGRDNFCANIDAALEHAKNIVEG